MGVPVVEVWSKGAPPTGVFCAKSAQVADADGVAGNAPFF